MLIRLIYASTKQDGVDLTNSSAFCCKRKLTITTGDLTGAAGAFRARID